MPQAYHEFTQIDAQGVARVLIIGAECTGKTTLCQALSSAFNAPWALEYMRPYLQRKWDEMGDLCAWDDLLPIAKGQIDAQNRAVLAAKNQGARFVFCDTGFLLLMVYAHLYYDRCPDPILWGAIWHEYEHIWLTDACGIPYQLDDLRDPTYGRAFVRTKIVDALLHLQKPYLGISGDLEARLRLARCRLVRV